MGKHKTTILVIDDEPSILQSLRGILTDEGYRFLAAESGFRGLNILAKNEVDIVLLDAWMPKMDGLETLKRIKEKSPNVEIIIMSGHGTEETAEKALELGASDFIEKPISLDSLLDSIKQLLEKKEDKIITVQSGKTISASFYESICIYPEQGDILSFFGALCRKRFFKVIVATEWTDVLAMPNFITIIHPSAVRKSEWPILFNYLRQVPDTHERFALLSKAHQPRIPIALRKFFKIIEDTSDLEEYILNRSKQALRRIKLKLKAAFIAQRRKDVQAILSKRSLQREFLIMKFARYYNVATRTIKRDLSKISQSTNIPHAIH